VSSAARRRYGLLEKKKDYILRAKDFHNKEKTLVQLRRKAEERNPDEFYFAMQRVGTKDGVLATRHAVDLSPARLVFFKPLREAVAKSVLLAAGMKAAAILPKTFAS
jgi:Utp11 protein